MGPRPLANWTVHHKSLCSLRMLRVTFSIPFITPNAVSSFQLAYLSASFFLKPGFPSLSSLLFHFAALTPQGYWWKQKENQEFCYSVNVKSLSYYSLGCSVEVSVSNNPLSFHSLLDRSSIKNKEGLYTMDRINLFIDRIVSDCLYTTVNQTKHSDIFNTLLTKHTSLFV
jgi:hypothetical protein